MVKPIQNIPTVKTIEFQKRLRYQVIMVLGQVLLFSR